MVPALIGSMLEVETNPTQSPICFARCLPALVNRDGGNDYNSRKDGAHAIP